MILTNWNIEETCGYKPLTTFYTDFSIADKFNTNAIQDTYDTIISQWKDNYKYLTELVMVLNWKIWEHYDTNKEYAEKYLKLWENTDSYACTNLVGEELEYFFKTTD